MRALYACTLLAAAAAAALHAPLPPPGLPPPLNLDVGPLPSSPPLLKTDGASPPSPPSPPPPPPPELPPLLRTDQPNLEFTIRVDGGKLQITFANGDYLHVKCFNATLDGALRRIEPATRVAKAKLECAPPRRGYADALRRLGVNLVPGGRLDVALPPDGAPFEGNHLAGLSLDRLALRRRDTHRAPPAPRPGLLQAPALATLTALEVRGVRMEDALKTPPPALNVLVLADSGVRSVPAATLARLKTLHAAEAEPEGESATLETLSLTLAEGRAPPDWASFPALKTLSLTSWSEEAPAPWESCAALRSLSVTSAGFSSLPEGWLAACPALESLSLHSVRSLESLPAGLLAGSCSAPTPAVCVKPALTRLDLRLGRLEKLPDALFDPVPNLRYLDLSRNKLLTLPGGIFTRLIKLETLSLSRNKLVGDSVYLEFGVLRQLSKLDLSYNPGLGDACTGDSNGRFGSGDSRLRNLTNLTELILSKTNVTRICRDWRETMTRLVFLRLHNTSITRLSFDDLQYKRDDATLHHSPAPSVELYGSNVTTIEYTATDAVKARERWVPPAAVAVRLSLPLVCDCGLFRAVRALRENPDHANLGGALFCAGELHRPLSTVPLDELLCEDRALTALLPPACVGREREQGEATQPRWRVRVDCERANLSAMPPLPVLDRDIEWDLRLAGNNIASLDELPSGLLKLDLRNNSVVNATAEAAAALGGATVALLAGNPLACDCGAAPLLDAVAALRVRRALLEEGGVARCGDGRALLDVAAAAHQHCRIAAAPRGVGPAVLGAVAAALGALALAALAVGSALARSSWRARVKGVLLGWGWLPRPVEPADPGRRFDAFVSFAHEDEEFTRALIARLETGPRALRLCVHSRDWAPGEYISAQIAASVRSARRTLCVLSRHYVRSGWARAEFREAAAASAREGTPRLVLVLLEEPDALGLDRELRRYLRANTYLRADHPQFWKRLREALPKPRPAAPDAPADPPEPTAAPPPTTAAPPAPAAAPPAPAAAPSAPAVASRDDDGAWRERLAGGARTTPMPA